MPRGATVGHPPSPPDSAQAVPCFSSDGHRCSTVTKNPQERAAHEDAHCSDPEHSVPSTPTRWTRSAQSQMDRTPPRFPIKVEHARSRALYSRLRMAVAGLKNGASCPFHASRRQAQGKDCEMLREDSCPPQSRNPAAGRGHAMGGDCDAGPSRLRCDGRGRSSPTPMSGASPERGSTPNYRGNRQSPRSRGRPDSPSSSLSVAHVLPLRLFRHTLPTSRRSETGPDRGDRCTEEFRVEKKKKGKKGEKMTTQVKKFGA